MADKKLRYVLDVDPDKGVASVKKFTRELDRGAKKAESSFSSLKTVIAALGIEYLAKQAADFGVGAVAEFNKAESAAFGFKRALGQSTGEINRLAEKFNAQTKNQFGLEAIQRTMTTNYKMMERLGLSAEQVFAVVERGADQAAIKNRDLEETAYALTSAIRGETESAKALGVDLSDTFMKTTAWGGSLGDVWDKLTQTEKAQLRYQQILEQTNHTVGAAEERYGMLTGKLAAAKQNWGDLQEIIGKTIAKSPMVLAVFDELNSALEDGSAFAGENKEALRSLVRDAILFVVDGVASATFALGMMERGWSGMKQAAYAAALGVLDLLDPLLNGLAGVYDTLAAIPGEIGKNYADAASSLRRFTSQIPRIRADVASVGDDLEASSRKNQEAIDGLLGKISELSKRLAEVRVEETKTAKEKEKNSEHEKNLIAEIERLKAEVATRDKTALKKAADETRKQTQEMFDAINEAAMGSAEFRISKVWEWADAMIAAGHDSETVYEAAMAKIDAITAASTKKNEKQVDYMKEVYRSFTESLRGWLADSIYNMEFSLQGFADFFSNTLRRMVAEAAANEIMLSLGFGGPGMGFSGAGISALSSGTMFAPGGWLGGAAAGGIGPSAQGVFYTPGMGLGSGTMLGAGMAGVAGAYGGRWLGEQAHGNRETKNTMGIAGGAATGFAVGGPWGAALGAGIGLLSSDFGAGPPSKWDTKTAGGISDIKKDPYGAMKKDLELLTKYMNEDYAEAAGLVLQQLDHITDETNLLSGVNAELAASWGDLTNIAFDLGVSVETTGLQSDRSREGMLALSSAAADFALQAITSGHASDELTAAAVSLAASSNTAATAADTQLSSMSGLAEALYRAGENTWALSRAQEAAQAAQMMLNLVTEYGYGEYQKYQEAQEKLIANEQRRAELMKELAAGVDETRYAEIQGELAALNKESEKYISYITQATGATEAQAGSLDDVDATATDADTSIRRFGDGIDQAGGKARAEKKSFDDLWKSIDQFHDKRMTLTVDRVEAAAPPKHHAGLFRSPSEHLAVIRADEMVVPPERRFEFASQVMQEPGAPSSPSAYSSPSFSSPSPSGGGGGQSAPSAPEPGGASPVAAAQFFLNGEQLANVVIPILLDRSSQGDVVVFESGVGRTMR